MLVFLDHFHRKYNYQLCIVNKHPNSGIHPMHTHTYLLSTRAQYMMKIAQCNHTSVRLQNSL